MILINVMILTIVMSSDFILALHINSASIEFKTSIFWCVFLQSPMQIRSFSHAFKSPWVTHSIPRQMGRFHERNTEVGSRWNGVILSNIYTYPNMIF